jgi:hypothetical protein
MANWVRNAPNTLFEGAFPVGIGAHFVVWREIQGFDRHEKSAV